MTSNGGRSRKAAAAPPEEVDPPADPDAVAREICLRQLTARARTRAQLAETLTRRGVPGPVADRVLDRFTELGLIDDRAFAETFVSSRHRERGLARRSLAMQLRQCGVSGDIADRALSQIDADDEQSRARALATSKARALVGLPSPVATRRLVGMLARRGYGPGLAYEIARDVLSGVDDVGVLDSGEVDHA